MRTIIGNIIDDGIAGTTVGAVYEWVTVPAILRIEQFLEAVMTDRQVRRNKDRSLFSGVTLPYFKAGKIDRR